MWINTTNTSNSPLKSIVRLILDVKDWKYWCVAHRTTMWFEHRRGSIANSNRAPDKRRVTHAFVEECAFREPNWALPTGTKPLLPISMHLLHAALSTGPGTLQSGTSLSLFALGASNFCPRMQIEKAVAIAAHVCEEEEARPGLRPISVQEEPSKCCMDFQLFYMKCQSSFVPSKYHKRNAILLQQLLS